MSGRKSLILVLPFLIVSYHMSRLTVVITHNPSRIRPSSVTSLATIFVLWLSCLNTVSTNKSIAHLDRWKSRQGYFYAEYSVERFLERRNFKAG